MVTIDSRAAKWLALALLVSLGVNLFLGGLLAGRYFGPQHRTFARSEAYERPGQEFFRRLIGRVPAEHRAAFEDVLSAKRPDMERTSQALRESRTKIREAVRAEPFDRAKLEAAFAEVRERNMALQKSVHEAMAEAVQKLPAEARGRLSEWRPGERVGPDRHRR
ncbi:MAG TPA: periplasmic heavy metal sensor [Alphaproteobacteria bacterium]|nr:periplasmic heavy metal sensor [Alphaproteobacteria bacterium]